MFRIEKVKSFFVTLLLRNSPNLAREHLEKLVAGYDPGPVTFDKYERMLLKNILKLRGTTAADVMVQRADIAFVNMDDSHDDIMKTMIAEGHSRMPATRGGNLDKVEGFLHIKDLAYYLNGNNKSDFASLLRSPIYISPAIKIMDLLSEMREEQRHLALVVDEHGGTDGLITIEDLVEKIVGEINDEHDEDVHLTFEYNSDGSATVDARLELEKIEEITGPLLSEEGHEEIDTIGGLVIDLEGRVPSRGEIVRHASGLEMEILKSDPRRVKLLKIHKLADIKSKTSEKDKVAKDKTAKDKAEKDTAEDKDSK